jgi:hypothetical protein
MDTTDFKVNREKLEDVAKQQDDPKEEAMMKTIGTQKARYGDRHLAVGRRKQPRNGVGGSLHLAAARWRLARCAILALRKRHRRQGPGKENVRAAAK